jgi:hypothetical protein
LLAACGGDSDQECGDPGAWSAQVLAADENISGAPSLAFENDGALHIVYPWLRFDETEPTPSAEGGVVWIHGADGIWGRETLSDFPGAGQPSVTVSEGRLHFVWATGTSIYYRERVGEAWSGPAVELTSTVETPALGSPGMAVGPDGELALVYYLWDGAGNGPSRISLRWIEDGAISGEPVTLLAWDRGCVATDAAFDPDGVLNVVARCRTGGEAWTLHWIDVDPDGSVTANDLGWKLGPDQPHMAITADGVAHALWTAFDDKGIFHALRIDGTWSEPMRVAPAARTGRFGIAARDDEAVAYYVEDNSDDRVTFLSSRNGQPLAPDCERLPDLVADRWWSSVAFYPRAESLATVTWDEDASSWAVASLPL